MPTEERDASAELGKLVHDACDRELPLDDIEPAARPRVQQFRRWLERSGAERLVSEFQVFNLREGYAGTPDLLCRFPSGEVWLIDLKTGNVETWLGTGTSDPGDEKAIGFYEPGGISVAGDTLYIADTNHHRIVAIDIKTKAARVIEITLPQK